MWWCLWVIRRVTEAELSDWEDLYPCVCGGVGELQWEKSTQTLPSVLAQKRKELGGGCLPSIIVDGTQGKESVL